MVLLGARSPRGIAAGSQGVSLAGGTRWSGLTGAEILPAHDYRDKDVY
jgi:hypothetical protein